MSITVNITETVNDVQVNAVVQTLDVQVFDGGSVPVGGTTDQVLGKISNDDYDYTWIDQTGGGGNEVPAGGLTNQVLGKLSNTDFDYDWINQSGGGGLPVGTENDLLQANNLGVFEAKSTTLVNKSLTPFLNSPLAGILDIKNVVAWDSFNRADSSDNLGVADSGQTWTRRLGNNRLVSGEVFATTSTLSIDTIDVNPDHSYLIHIKCRALGGSTGNAGVVFYKDADNYVLCQWRNASSLMMVITKVVAGVSTQLAVNSSSQQVDNRNYIELKVKLQKNTSNTEIFIGMYYDFLGLPLWANVISDFAVFIGLDKIGITTDRLNLTQSSITSFIAERTQ